MRHRRRKIAMSKNNATPSTDDETLKLEEQETIQLDDIEFPGQSEDGQTTDVGSGTYTIFLPAGSSHGSSAEYARVLTVVEALQSASEVGAVTKVSISAGLWAVAFGLKGKLTTAVAKAAFAAVNPILNRSEVVTAGLVPDELGYWRFMNGTKVLKKGKFKKTV